jgi:hypothetical protein
MIHRRILACLVTACIIGLLFQPAARGQPTADDGLRYVPGSQLRGGHIRTGNLRLLGALGLQAEYNDNIFYASGEPGDPVEKDWIGHIFPTLFLDYDMPQRGGIRIGYKGDLAFYNEFKENDWQNHLGQFDLDYRSPGGLIAVIKNNYARVSDPYGSANDFGLGVPQTKRWYNDLKSTFGFRFSRRFRLVGLFDAYIQKYDEQKDFTQNWKGYRGGLGAGTQIMTKTWGFLRYYYGERDYIDQLLGVNESNDADFTFHQVNGGVNWDPGAKWAGELNLGYQWRKFKNELDPSGQPYKNKNTWVAETSVNYLPRSANVFETQQTSLLTFNLLRGVRQVGSNTNEFFDDTKFSFIMRQLLNPKWLIRWEAAYRHQKFENPQSEKVDTFFFRIGLMYKIQNWIGLGAHYEYDNKDSSVDLNDYKLNRFKITLEGAI